MVKEKQEEHDEGNETHSKREREWNICNALRYNDAMEFK